MIRHPLLWLPIPQRNRVLQACGRSPEADFLSPFERRHRCIFFHIPKTGGITVSESLLEGFHTNHRIFRRCEQQDPSSVRQFWKFAILRDPVDRFVSAYRFLSSGGISEQDRAFRKQYGEAFRSFEGFLGAFFGEKGIQQEVHFRPQIEFLSDAQGRMRMDFLGRFECLSEDFGRICTTLKVARALRHDNPTRNEIPRPDITPETARALRAFYARDVKLRESIESSPPRECEISSRGP